jgi:hypothetical protein
MLTALGGCLGMNEPNYEPEPRTARPVRAAWRTADGVPPSADTYARQAPMSAADTRTSAAKVMTPVQPATATQPAVAEGDGFDPTLVKATLTKAPRTGAGAEAKGTPAEAPSGEASKSAMPPAVKTGPEMPAAAAAASVCSGANPSALRLVNSRRIAFHYEVKDSAAVGPVSVEVWGTQDLKTWKKYDAVAVKGKSHVIEVKDEGLYGFTLLARGPRGGGKDRPQPGEAPQVWVAVDFTRPVVQFVGAELNILAHAPTLVVRWTASDKNLGPRPVTIFYAEQSDGPWTLLAANIENSGRYEWVLPATLPSSLYLRVQTADLMGNVGLAQTPNLMLNMRSATLAANPVRKPEPSREVIAAVHEPEQPHPHPPAQPQPRLLALPPTPALDLTHVPPAPALPEAPPAEIHIVGVEGDKCN